MASNLAKHVLYISNIPWTVGRQELALYFARFGYVHNAVVVFDKQTGFSRGHGYVTYLKKEHVDLVLKQGQHTLDGKDLSLTLYHGNENLTDNIAN